MWTYKPNNNNKNHPSTPHPSGVKSYKSPIFASLQKESTTVILNTFQQAEEFGMRLEKEEILVEASVEDIPIGKESDTSKVWIENKQ